MTEGEFIKFYKKKNKSKNHEEVREKIYMFWEALLKAIDEDNTVVFKNWGTFEKKQIKPRRIVIPKMEKEIYTAPKTAIKFRAGAGLKDLMINGGDSNE